MEYGITSLILATWWQTYCLLSESHMFNLNDTVTYNITYNDLFIALLAHKEIVLDPLWYPLDFDIFNINSRKSNFDILNINPWKPNFGPFQIKPVNNLFHQKYFAIYLATTEEMIDGICWNKGFEIDYESLCYETKNGYQQTKKLIQLYRETENFYIPLIICHLLPLNSISILRESYDMELERISKDINLSYWGYSKLPLPVLGQWMLLMTVHIYVLLYVAKMFGLQWFI